MVTRAKSPPKRATKRKVSLPPNKGGRPPKLTADDKTLATLAALGQIHATVEECAAALGVTKPTFLKFRDDNAVVSEALDKGQGMGRISLRRKLNKLADTHPAAAIFLAKNLLNMTDRVANEVTGKDGAPLAAGVGPTIVMYDNGRDTPATD